MCGAAAVSATMIAASSLCRYSSAPDQADALRNALMDPKTFVTSRVTWGSRKISGRAAIGERPSLSAVPDDDIAFPHAIDVCLAYLEAKRRRRGQGYVVDFGIHDGVFDIRHVRYFTPTLGADESLQRLYDLMRRYQPFLWAVFRTDVLVAALEASLKMDIIMFQEFTIMNVAAAQGKIARLPHIFSLRGMEIAFRRRPDAPMYGFLYDAERLFSSYVLYRNNLVAFLRTHMGASAWDRATRKIEAAVAEGVVEGHRGAGATTVEQLLDVIHMIKMVPAFDTGQLNYAAQRLLGAPYPPIPITPQWSGPMDRRKGDVVRPGNFVGGAICGAMRFSWRSRETKFISMKPRSPGWKPS